MITNLTVFPGRCEAASPEPMTTAETNWRATVEHVWKRTMFMGSGLSAHALPRNDGEAAEAVS
jgi:hypothetical protein